jgi:alanine dehydrogenase
VIFVSEEQVRAHVPFSAVLEAVARAFVAFEAGESMILPVVRGHGGGREHFFGVKAGRDGSIPILGLKAGSYVPDNPTRGLPAHSSTTLLLDDITGQPVAVVQANYLNGLRTSAVNALAVRALAREDASTLGIIGIGGQAVFEALAVAHVRPIRRILAVGSSPERRSSFADAIRERLDIPVTFVEASVAARDADVLVTVTPARSPVVRAEWVRPGTHISAMGADNIGKQELDVELVRRAECWVDHPEQSVTIGEMQHACRAGLVSVESLRGRTLGGILRTGTRGRRSAEEITIFDSSGLAIQDLAAAHLAYTCVSRTSNP